MKIQFFTAKSVLNLFVFLTIDLKVDNLIELNQTLSEMSVLNL